MGRQPVTRWRVAPGTMGLVVWLTELMGPDNVDPGTWPGPVYFYGNDEQADMIRELLELEFPGRPCRWTLTKEG